MSFKNDCCWCFNGSGNAVIIALLFCLGLSGCSSTMDESPILPGRPLVSAEVKMYNSRPTIFLNDTPEAPMLYALPDVPGGRWTWEELPQHNIEQFCQHGVRLFQVDIFLDHIWLGPQKFDLSIAQKQVRGVLEVCPDASIFFRFHVNAPKWWVEEYPEEYPIYEEGAASPDVSIGLSRILEADPRNPERASLASQAWLESAGAQLGQFCRDFSQTEEGRAVAGIHVASGVYGEWHYWGFMNFTVDQSPHMTDRFRSWLTDQYETDRVLQQAWSAPGATIATAKVPTKAEREKLNDGIFRDPVLDRKVIDYFTVQHQVVADDIIYFARVVKENWPRPVIVGTFYGYFFSVFGRQASGGHLALHQILESEYIDYLSGPQPYYPEDGYEDGEPYRSRSLIHSIYLNKKLWLDEYDQQPRRSWPWISEYDNRKTFEAISTSNIAQIKRNVWFPFTKGQGLWLYDFGNASMNLHPRNQRNKQMGTSGYWDNPIYMSPIGRIKDLVDSLINEPYAPESDVLLVYDTEVIKYLKSEQKEKCPITEHVVNWTNLAMYYAGVSFEPIHLDDLPKVDLKNYRLIVFANTFLLEDSDKTFLRQNVLNNGRHVLWVYAPGYSNGQKNDREFVEEVTGMLLKEVTMDSVATVRIDRSFGNIPDQKAKGKYDPLWVVRDQEVEVLGKYQNGGTAFARKKLVDHTSWYIGVPPTDGALLREIARQSGAHLYTENGEIVYAGGGVLVVHTAHGGQTKIRLQNGQDISLDLPESPQTIVLDSQTGQCLICD